MRKVFLTLLIVAPLMAGCVKDDEPLIPELKGRWDLISLHKMREARTVGSSKPVQPDNSDNCAVSYVTFGKQRIVMRLGGIPTPVFNVTNVKAQGQRISITGGPDSNPANHGRLVLLLRNGEIRFDDIYDETGRSVKYERIPDGHSLRSKGANTLGDAMRMFLDLKPCKA